VVVGVARAVLRGVVDQLVEPVKVVVDLVRDHPSGRTHLGEMAGQVVGVVGHLGAVEALDDATT
jgi:hypothetical protein